MKCKACGYEGETFPHTPMGKYCCPQCGAGKEEAVGQPVNQSVADYAAMLEKLATAPVEVTRYEDTQEFARLDAWGRKNAAFLNQFPADTIATILNFDRHYLRGEGWPDELWNHSVKQWVSAGNGRTGASFLPSTCYEGALGFEVLYAAGGVLEFRRKLRKGLWDDADGKWHTYYAPCRFIDGDVRPLFDGQRMKPSGLFKSEKVYRFKG